MSTTTELDTANRRDRVRGATIAGALLVFTAIGGLVAYKASASLKVLAKANAEHTLHAKTRWIESAGLPAPLRPLVDSLNYLSWVFIALAFGVVIGAMTRAFVPTRWLESTVAARGARGQLLATLMGAPLMLCSCCVAPVFEGVYERTRRLGPSLGLMVAAPALNPAVLAVTFLLFPARLGWTRAAVALALALVAAPLIGERLGDARAPGACPIETEAPSWGRFAGSFAQSLRSTAWNSLPAILIGVIVSAAIGGLLPLDRLANIGGGGTVLVILLVALIATPLALPTFGEIPLSLALVAAGAPLGAALALMIAGPTVNLPSLLTLARATSWKVAASTAAVVVVAAFSAGVLLDTAA